jgi:pimeloyl-ACP methyl ester carboxylesterase
VLCGHSLGGAVAKLCTLRLLREQPEWPPPRVRCITFATPAVGNSALAELVEAAGWATFFKTYVLPEDQLMKALAFTTARRQQQPAATGAAAEAQPQARSGGGGNGGGGAAAGQEDTSAALAEGGREALTTVAGLIALPWTRESAKRKLRSELRGGWREGGAVIVGWLQGVGMARLLLLSC